jgi:hypothetical protein
MNNYLGSKEKIINKIKDNLKFKKLKKNIKQNLLILIAINLLMYNRLYIFYIQ